MPEKAQISRDEKIRYKRQLVSHKRTLKQYQRQLQQYGKKNIAKC